MTNLEFDTFDEAACPCGEGRILRHVASTDYRHTGVRISYSIDCAGCARAWKLDHGTLVLKASEGPYVAAKFKSDSACQELQELAKSLVKSYCERATFKSKKAELEHLVSLEICRATYASYIKDRRSGLAMHELAYGLSNVPWLFGISKEAGKQSVLAELLRAKEQLTAETERAAKLVIRRGIRNATAP